MKKVYEKPSVESEPVFETLAAGSGLNDPIFEECDPARTDGIIISG